jgi:hypothetical protein
MSDIYPVIIVSVEYLDIQYLCGVEVADNSNK